MNGNVESMRDITKQLESNSFQNHSDVLALAHVMKVLLREHTKKEKTRKST